ncbi:MAG: M42 family metallopeptidase [Verrucomicrobiales bacterium]|nr:M42 family metallopeptidase [Verrucomicrobiales bacterium]
MKKADKDFLLELLSTPSPTGFEVAGQRVWAGRVRGFADSVESDAYGTAWATVKSGRKNAKSVMIEAHADEIGYIVKYLSPEGFVHLDRIGGSDPATGRGRKLVIYGDKGEVRGLIGNTAIHIREDRADEKAPKIHQLYVDVGAKSKKEVEKMGIRVGHPAVYADSAELLGDHRLVGRALDNRIGGFIIAKVLERVAKAKRRPDFDVIAVNSVQEEIGGYGAKMATHRLMPDVAICLDVTHATDTPGIKKEVHGDVKLGGGPSVQHGTCNHPAVVERMMEVAKKAKIPLQHESSSRYSGTDTDSIYHVQAGIPSGLISLPLRYMHSIIELVDLGDVEQVVDLLEAFVMSLQAGDEFSVKL